MFILTSHYASFGATTALVGGNIVFVPVSYSIRTTQQFEYPNNGGTTKINTIRYVGYNYRHKPVIEVSQEVNEGVNGVATVVMTLWAYDFFHPGIADSDYEVNAKVVDGGVFAFEDFEIGRLKLTYAPMSAQNPIPVLQNADEEYMLYDLVSGKLLNTLTQEANRKSGGTSYVSRTTLSQAMSACEGRELVFDGKATKVYDDDIPIAGDMEISNRSFATYQEITPVNHRITTIIGAIQNDGTYLNTTEILNVNAPIPRLQRVAKIDSSRFAKRSLDENPVAAASRYGGFIYNNSCPHLAFQGMGGLQQLLGACESDFITNVWLPSRSAAFADLKTLEGQLQNYSDMIGGYVSASRNIRLRYGSYVGAVIRLLEYCRGLHDIPSYGILGNKSKYPFFTTIQANYQDYLGRAFDFISEDNGCVDTGAELQDFYLENYPVYRQFMSGETFSKGFESKKLGSSIDTKSRLKLIHEFQLRYMWAAIDRALSEAFLGDSSYSGSLTMTDPADRIEIGDSLSIDYMDTTVEARTTSVSLTASAETLDYRLGFRKLIQLGVP